MERSKEGDRIVDVNDVAMTWDDVAVVIPTLQPARGHELIQLVGDLTREKIPFLLFVDEGNIGLRRNTNRALQAGKWATWVLLLQDDVRLAPGFSHLALSALAQADKAGVVSLYSYTDKGMELYEPGQVHLWTMPKPNRFRGEQALAIKGNLVADLVAWMESEWEERNVRDEGHDVALASWAWHRQQRIAISIPSLVQHCSLVSTVGHAYHTSPSYRLAFGSDFDVYG